MTACTDRETGVPGRVSGERTTQVDGAGQLDDVEVVERLVGVGGARGHQREADLVLQQAERASLV